MSDTDVSRYECRLVLLYLLSYFRTILSLGYLPSILLSSKSKGIQLLCKIKGAYRLRWGPLRDGKKGDF